LAQELSVLHLAAYLQARREAAADTGLPLRRFPPQCPWSLEDMRTEGWLPPEGDPHGR
jgi:Domain of unknown function DUF29